MNELSTILGRWTPYSVIIVMVVSCVMAVILWYAFHYMTPPDWVTPILSGVGLTGAYGMGHISGTVSANGVAKDAVRNVIGAAQNASGSSSTVQGSGQ